MGTRIRTRGVLSLLLFFVLWEGMGMGDQNKMLPEEKQTLYLVPFDNISTEVLRRIGEALKDQLKLDYRIMASIPIPGSSFNPGRRQYLSPDFLSILAEKYSAPGRRILGIVDQDLYVPDLNFVFGQADIKNKTAVISLVRLRRKFYGLPEDQELFERRALTEAVHELGHTWGLSHCTNPDCVMFFSNSLRDTDRKGYRFCDGCLKCLERKDP